PCGRAGSGRQHLGAAGRGGCEPAEALAPGCARRRGNGRGRLSGAGAATERRDGTSRRHGYAALAFVPFVLLGGAAKVSSRVHRVRVVGPVRLARTIPVGVARVLRRTGLVELGAVDEAVAVAIHHLETGMEVRVDAALLGRDAAVA